MSLSVQKRDPKTIKPKHLRKSGILPMALLERTHSTMLIQAPIDDLRQAMRHADGLGRLDILIDGEKKPRKAIVKFVENDPLKHAMIHVVLQEVSDDDQVKVDIPIHAIGEPLVMKDGDFVLLQGLDHLKIKGRMADLPERIDIDVTNMEVGSHISASDIVLPEGIDLLSSPDSTVFSLRQPQLAVEEPTEVAAEGEEAAGEPTQEGKSEE